MKMLLVLLGLFLAAMKTSAAFRAWVADLLITTGFHIEPTGAKRRGDDDDDAGSEAWDFVVTGSPAPDERAPCWN